MATIKMKTTNLDKVLAELNAPKTYDGETFESLFNFKTRVVDDHYSNSGKRFEIFDANECYYIDYAYENHVGLCQIADEFGFEPPTSYNDDVHDKIEAAVKKDFGEESYLEWVNNVVMMVAIW